MTPLTVVCWKWSASLSIPGHLRNRASVAAIPTDNWVTHIAVNRLYRMLQEHLSGRWELVCITDNPSRILPEVRVVPLPHLHPDPGYLYRRLWLFSKNARVLIGERVLALDLDIVIRRNITHMARRTEPLVIWRRPYLRKDYWDCSVMLLSPGQFSEVWDDFDPVLSPVTVDADNLSNTDSSWIWRKLGETPAAFKTPEVIPYAGVCDAPRTEPPESASIIAFNRGRRPWTRGEGAYRRWLIQSYLDLPDVRPTHDHPANDGWRNKEHV